MDILSAQLALPGELGSAPTVGVSAPSVTSPADPTAIQRFGDALAAGPAPASSVSPVGTSTAVNGVLPAQDVNRVGGTLGDSILKGLQNVSEDFRKSWASVNATLDGKVDSVSDLLKLQMGMAQVSLQFELIGKGVSRATQNIDQLVKLQ
jgi:type III secretion protein I